MSSRGWRLITRQWPSMAVIFYVVVGWPAGIWMLTRPELTANVLGVLLTSHTLICSAYLIHDCVHNAVFSSRKANDRLGVLMGWINGACLADYSRLRKKHLRHHSDRVDVLTFDYRKALAQSPAWLRRTVLMLEWAYVPAVELLMRAMLIATPFSNGVARDRFRMVAQLSVRLLGFVILAAVALKAVFFYAVAYVLFLTTLRFMDAFQHTYEVYVSRSLAAAGTDPRRDLRYEYENTYSNLVSEQWGWLNLLVLNFPYHNAHHVRPGVAWHRLPALHRSLYGKRDQQVITCRELLASYHRHRVSRIMAAHYGEVAASGDRAGGFLGAVGVSFLTAV